MVHNPIHPDSNANNEDRSLDERFAAYEHRQKQKLLDGFYSEKRNDIDVLLKLRTNRTPKEPFTTLMGMRMRICMLNNRTTNIQAMIDNSNIPFYDNQQLLCSVSGSGVFKDAESEQAVRHIFFNEEIRYWMIQIPDFGNLVGMLRIEHLDIQTPSSLPSQPPNTISKPETTFFAVFAGTEHVRFYNAKRI